MKNRTFLLALLFLQPWILGSCQKDNTGNKPNIVFLGGDYIVGEDIPSGMANIPIYLSGSADQTVTVDYSTVDSTAIAGSDFQAVASGKLTFQPGETSKTIAVQILHDTVQHQDVSFKLKFSNPVHASLPAGTMNIKIINVDFHTLIWSDEFDAPQLNTNYWNYEQGNNGGWGNNELEVYTNSTDNASVDTGYLFITARNPSGSQYTSARLTTEGKMDFTYGRVEIRAKLPQGQGIWPALWMLGSNINSVSWPKCGEIDMMELLGQEPGKVYGTVHWDDNGHKSLGSNYTLTTGNFNTDFHLFTFIWTPNYFTWLIDNHAYFVADRRAISKFPFDLPEFFIFNVAVGGNWPGPPDQTTIFPQSMVIDYIRVFQ
jgi:hypothetical protein